MEDIIDKIMTMLVHGFISFIIPVTGFQIARGKGGAVTGEGGRGSTLIYGQTVACSRIRSHVLNAWNGLGHAEIKITTRGQMTNRPL